MSPRALLGACLVATAVLLAAAGAEQPHAPLPVDKLTRGERFAEQGRVDLFVAATAVWDLKPDDPRLWEPAADLGRRLIEKAEMPRKPHNCPSSFKDYATYKRLIPHRFTRVDELYQRPDPGEEMPPKLYINEAIHAAGIYGPTGLINNLIVSRGKVYTDKSIQASVVFANGDVTAQNVQDVVIISDGNVTLNSRITVGLIVARGTITAKGGADGAVLMAGGKITLENQPTKNVRHSVIKENETNPLGYITFFELSTVGLEAKAEGKTVHVTAVAAGKPFAKAGVKVDDVIAEVNDKKPDSPESLRRLLRDALAVGDATVKLQRGDKIETVKVTLPE